MLCVTLAHYFIVNPAELAEQNTLKTKKTTYVTVIWKVKSG